jgi:Na+-translocating ferredoxin:NAD+ oxidoreductase RNF subunit RnfB
MDLLTQTLIIGGTGCLCAVVLALAARFLAVDEDPRIETVGALLPGINCGGCGYAGCGDYAREIVLQGAPVDRCQPGGRDVATRLAQFMGVSVTLAERQVAIVLCKGDNTAATHSAAYNGLLDCGAAQQIGGNGKDCRYGCLGLASCCRACPVQAIELLNGLAIVHPDLCIGCGQCVATCPRKLIKLIPESRSIHVLCSSRDRGPEVRKVCSVGCIACTLCAKAVTNVGISMQNNLAVVDYTIPLTGESLSAKCPQNTIEIRPGTRGGPA